MMIGAVVEKGKSLVIIFICSSSLLILTQITDTVFLQGNDLNGTWPVEFCPEGFLGKGEPNVQNFGIDCHKVKCVATCCDEWRNCFFHGQGEEE